MDGPTTDDDRFERVPLTAWDRLRTALERACTGRFEADEDEIRIRSGAASIAIGRDGTVDAGMPLHGFVTTEVEYVDVDEARGELRFEVGETTYRFRQP